MKLDQQEFRVVLNDERRYSVLPVSVANPPGWRDAGKRGTLDECLAFVREQWTDMRPSRETDDGMQTGEV